MKKIFLVLTLLVSGFGFADFSISTLHCDLYEDFNPLDMSEEITVRLDEKRKTMRVDLFPESQYKELKPDNKNLSDTYAWVSEFEWNSYLFEIRLEYSMAVIVKQTLNSDTREASFYCSII